MPTAHDRLLQEIQAQPACLRQLLEAFPDSFATMHLPGAHTEKLIGIAEGSSYNALKIAAPFVEELTGLNQFTFDPESLENKFEVAQLTQRSIKHLFQHSYFLTVSQSGETGSVLQVLGRLQKLYGFSDRHSPLLAITNNPDGTMAKRFRNHFDLAVGAEQSIAATKSMTASILALLLFGLYTGKQRGWVKSGFYQSFAEALVQIPDHLAQLLDNTPLHRNIQGLAERLCANNQFLLLSKGYFSAILPEAGLKLTETSRNMVWTDNTESFKHGRKVMLYGVQGVRPNCLYVIPPNLNATAAAAFFNDVTSHFYVEDERVFSTDGIFFIRFENSPPLPSAFQTALAIAPADVLVLPETHGVESLFMGLVFFHLLSYYLAQAKGEDPNDPALQKAVTR